MILLFLFFWLFVMIVPLALLFALPIWGARRLRRRGVGLLISLLPLLVPVLTIASEAYPQWLVRRIAQEPVSIRARPERVESIYAFNGYTPEAVRLVAQFPSVRFTEGLIDENRRGEFRWERMPRGLVRFQGRRVVEKSLDCLEDEVSVPIIAARYPHKATWYCTRWTPVGSLSAVHEMRNSIRDYRVGPFSIFERRDFVVRRLNNKSVNVLVSASITGGIWWQLTEWLGDVTGISSLANGNTLGPYGASTDQYLGGLSGEEFLMTGRIAGGPTK